MSFSNGKPNGKRAGRPQPNGKPRERRVMLPSAQRRAIYIVSWGLWLTGAFWLFYHYFMTSQDEFGFEGAHPLEQGWLIAHAFFAFWAVWMFGLLWAGHIKHAWKSGRHRSSGVSMVILLGWLCLSGFPLYYLGSDSWRSWTSLAHWVPGMAGIILFLCHLRAAERSRNGR